MGATSDPKLSLAYRHHLTHLSDSAIAPNLLGDQLRLGMGR